MILEVQILPEGDEYEVQVWNVEEQEREEDLERTFPTFEDASAYTDELARDKRYVVTHV